SARKKLCFLGFRLHQPVMGPEHILLAYPWEVFLCPISPRLCTCRHRRSPTSARRQLQRQPSFSSCSWPPACFLRFIAFTSMFKTPAFRSPPICHFCCWA